MDTGIDVENHIRYKAQMRDISDGTEQRMLQGLALRPGASYAELLEAALFRDPPEIVYHTSARHLYESIRSGGLRIGDERNWTPEQRVSGQPKGVYVGPEPDLRGKWSHWSHWDIWAIDLGDLPWVHDRLNPGCWAITQNVPPAAIRIHVRRGLL